MHKNLAGDVCRGRPWAPCAFNNPPAGGAKCTALELELCILHRGWLLMRQPLLDSLNVGKVKHFWRFWLWLCQCHLIGTQAHTKTSMKTIPKFIQTFDQNCALISALHALSSARHPHCALISSRLSVQNTFFRAFHILLTCLLRNRQITLLISHIRVIVRPIASAFSAIVWSQCLYKTGWQHGSCQPVHFIFSLFS